MWAKKESEVIVKSGKEYYELVMSNYTVKCKSFVDYWNHREWQIFMTSKMKSKKMILKLKKRMGVLPF